MIVNEMKLQAYEERFERVFDSIDYHLYREWLPESGEKLCDADLFTHYLNLRSEVTEHELVIYIYLPLK